MTATPQTNVDLKSLAEILKRHESFALCGHVSPDGDCIGSQLALYHALRALEKKVVCLSPERGDIDKGLMFLPGVNAMVAADTLSVVPDVFIACDVPTVDRMGAEVAEARSRAQLTVTIDHHASPERISDLAYVDPDVPSTTMLIWELVSYLGVRRNADIAMCAYTGLVTDTGCFQFQNTDESAFAAAYEMVSCGANPAFVARNVFQNRTMASLKLEEIVLSRMEIECCGELAISYLMRSDFEETGATKPDAEPLVNVLRSIEGVRVACLLRQESDHIRGSLRAKDDVDVSAPARKMGGGGHKAAAGFTLYEPLAAARATALSILSPMLSPCATKVDTPLPDEGGRRL